MKKRHPWRQYDTQIFKSERKIVRPKPLPDDIAHIIDVHGNRHPLDMEGNTGLWRTA